MDQSKNIQLLVSQAQAGDTEAYGEIYDLLVDRIYRFIYFKTGKSEEAEDLTEQTFLKAYESLNNFKNQGLPFEAWIFRIARNLVIDHYRSKKRFIDLEEIEELAGNNLPLDEWVGIKITYQAVLEVIKKLPAAYQEIIILKFIEEKENEEISIYLNKPVDQIRVLQSRALKALRRLLSNLPQPVNSPWSTFYEPNRAG